MIRRSLLLSLGVASALEATNLTTAPANVTFPKMAAFPAFPMKFGAPTGSAVGLVAAGKPAQLPTPALPLTPTQYRILLQRMVAYKRWRMAYFYLFSWRYQAYVSVMPPDAELSEETKTLKTFLSKSALFFDILANYEISGFIGCILLLTWTTPPPTDYMSAVAYYQSIKTVYAFWTWQFYLIWHDYMELFPDAYVWVPEKTQSFVKIAATYACFHAFNEWHVSKMMGLATLTDPSSDLTKAKLASFYWDEAFIKTIKILVIMKMWSWHYDNVPFLTKAPPFIAMALPYIGFTESYWEGVIATMNEVAAKKASQVAAAK